MRYRLYFDGRKKNRQALALAVFLGLDAAA
jgi:hypothetical protein